MIVGKNSKRVISVIFSTPFFLYQASCLAAENEKLNAGKIFMEAMADGVRETVCGDREQISKLIHTKDEKLRNTGYACLTSRQAKKATERMQKNTAPDDGDKGSSCWVEQETLKCKVWFPESTVKGITTPAGYRVVKHTSN